MAVVLVEFPCSFDGITSETMVVDSEHEFGFMTAGLVALGWISEDMPEGELEVEPEVEPEAEAPAAATPARTTSRRKRR